MKVLSLRRFVLFFILPFFSGCVEDLMYNYDCPTHVEINGEDYISHTEVQLAGFPANLAYDEDSFSFSYFRTLYHDHVSTDIYLTSDHYEKLVIGRKYALNVSDVTKHYDRSVYYKDKSYCTISGWIEFHDISFISIYEKMEASGSFELTAISEDGAETITLTKGTFHKLRMN